MNSKLREALKNDALAVPCLHCDRPTIVPGGVCVRCWPSCRTSATQPHDVTCDRPRSEVK